MKRFKILSILALIIIIGLVVFGCGGKSDNVDKEALFPDQDVMLKINFASGGGADVAMRAIQPFVEKELGQSLVFDYKGGAGGELGLNEYVLSEPSGYNIAHVSMPHIALQPLSRDTVYDPEEHFEFIAIVADMPSALLVKKDSPFKTLEDFIDYAKANPGKLAVSITGTMSMDHAAVILMREEMGIDIGRIVFDGGSEALASVMGGHVDAMLANVVYSEKYADELTTLVVASKERMDRIPDVPTFKEKGYDITTSNTRGVVALKGTPREQLDVLDEAFRKALTSPECQDALLKSGSPPLYLGPEDAMNYYLETKATYEKLLPLLEADVK